MERPALLMRSGERRVLVVVFFLGFSHIGFTTNSFADLEDVLDRVDTCQAAHRDRQAYRLFGLCSDSLGIHEVRELVLEDYSLVATVAHLGEQERGCE